MSICHSASSSDANCRYVSKPQSIKTAGELVPEFRLIKVDQTFSSPSLLLLLLLLLLLYITVQKTQPCHAIPSASRPSRSDTDMAHCAVRGNELLQLLGEHDYHVCRYHQTCV